MKGLYRPKSVGRLKRNEAIAIEPAIYLDFGVRIEDDFIV
jgi:Xaa-Pro aminopeptidase